MKQWIVYKTLQGMWAYDEKRHYKYGEILHTFYSDSTRDAYLEYTRFKLYADKAKAIDMWEQAIAEGRDMSEAYCAVNHIHWYNDCLLCECEGEENCPIHKAGGWLETNDFYNCKASVVRATV